MLLSQSDPARSHHSMMGGGNPAYLIGQDADGHWLAVETHGLGGGIFQSEAVALRYARRETDGRSGAVMATREPLTLRL